MGREELSDGGRRVRNGSDGISTTHAAAGGPSVREATDDVRLTHAGDIESQPFEEEARPSPPPFTVFAAPMVTQFIISFCISLIVWLLRLELLLPLFPTVAAVVSVPDALLAMDSALLEHPPTALVFFEKNRPETTRKEERLAGSVFGLNRYPADVRMAA
ncbi:hypothetical protein BKA82DRAFT_4350442 [Pisolithus tinctorius]|nr:hypothetical protein BKA82DRAFT_4350442 [Pisolithus tinctorius]